MAKVRFTLPFKRRLKTLTKRYRQIKIDFNPLLIGYRLEILSAIKSLG
ncbi:hypothetical protein [Nostoc sp.]